MPLRRSTPRGRRLGILLGCALLVGVVLVGWHIVQQASRPQLPAPMVPLPAPHLVPLPTPAAPSASSRGVAGIVELPGGQPAGGARVTLYRARCSWPEWAPQYLESVATSLDGKFRFATERGPDLLIGYELDGYAGDLVEALAQLPRQELRLVPGFELSGFVADGAGQPQPGCRITLEPLPGENRRTAVTGTGADGRFAFRNVSAGVVRVVARHPRWQPAVLPSVTIGAQRSVELRLDRPAVVLNGRVTTGVPPRPVAGARVLALPQAANAGLLDPTVMITNADGLFALSGLGRGNYRIEVRHAEFSTLVSTLAIGANPPLQQFELVPRSRVAGKLLRTVVEASLPPLTSLLLRARSGEQSRAPILDDGSFEFPDAMPVGWATLEFSDGARAFAKTGTAAMQVRVDEASRTELQVAVGAPTRMSGRLVDPLGQPVAAARLYATQAEQLAATLRETGSALLDIDFRRLGGQLTRAAQAAPDRLLAISAADGRWQVAGLAAGGVVLRIEHPDFAVRRVELQVQPAPALTDGPTIELVRGLSLRGRVERGGQPLAGTVITASGADAPAQAICGPDGAYLLTGLLPGVYRVRARFSTLPPLQREVEVAAATPAVDFHFPAGRFVTGAVIGNDGAPVEGALVMVRGMAGAPTLTDASGEFSVELPQKRVELQVFLGDRNARKTQPVEIGDSRVTIRLDIPATVTLRARVLGLPGRTHPASVLLRVQPLDGDDTTALSRVLDLPSGTLRYPWFPTAPCRLQLWCEGFAPFVKDLPDSRTGADLDLADVLLEPGASLEGRVVDSAGKPVPGCVVFLGDEADLDLFTPQTRSDADGRFLVTGICTASRTLVARAQGFAPRSLLLALPQDVLQQEPLAVVLERGATVEVAVGGDEAGGYVLLLRQDRVIGSAELDAEGRASFANCGVGSYVVQVLGDEPRRMEVVVRESGGVVKVSVP